MHSAVDKMRTTGDRAFSVSYQAVTGKALSVGQASALRWSEAVPTSTSSARGRRVRWALSLCL